LTDRDVIGPRKRSLNFLASRPGQRRRRPAAGVGNCAACHTLPFFSDFSFHNTGVTQVEYDAVHGEGAFADLVIPPLRVRSRDPDAFLPATEEHPDAAEPYRRPASADAPHHADLGLWNVFANPDFPEPQRKLWRLLCERSLAGAPARHPLLELLERCAPPRLLESSVARFKTPGLRDLGHSLPLMHNGEFDSIREVLGFYQSVSALARSGSLRNADPEIAGIAIGPSDVDVLEAFLLSLNEDYE
jgi:hypothetical protein